MTWLKSLPIPMDNNALERAGRPLAEWRRNSLLMGSRETGGGRLAAILILTDERRPAGEGG